MGVFPAHTNLHTILPSASSMAFSASISFFVLNPQARITFSRHDHPPQPIHMPTHTAFHSQLIPCFIQIQHILQVFAFFLSFVRKRVFLECAEANYVYIGEETVFGILFLSIISGRLLLSILLYLHRASFK